MLFTGTIMHEHVMDLRHLLGQDERFLRFKTGMWCYEISLTHCELEYNQIDLYRSYILISNN
jgi:hypothetical protein